MLKFFTYRKGINHLHVTQTLNTLLLMLKLMNLFCKKRDFESILKTQRYVIQANNREIGCLVMQYQNPFDVFFCDSAPQFIPFFCPRAPWKVFGKLLFGLHPTEATVFPYSFSSKNKKTLCALFHATFRTVRSFYIEPLFPFLFFFFSIFCILILRTDQCVNVTTQIPNWHKTGQSQFRVAVLDLLQTSSELPRIRLYGRGTRSQDEKISLH